MPRHQHGFPMKNQPQIRTRGGPIALSVIICSHNGADRVGAVLKALHESIHLDPRLWEVVLVDNASTDCTAATARNKWLSIGSMVRLSVVEEVNIGLMRARLKGACSAQGEILVFLDDDNIVMSDWSAIILERFAATPELGILGARGMLQPADGGGRPAWFPCVQWSYAVGLQGPDGVLSPCRKDVYGAGLCIRRYILLKLVEHNVEFLFIGRISTAVAGGEDTEICYYARALGWQIAVDNRLVFNHLVGRSRLNGAYVSKLAARDALLTFYFENVAMDLGLADARTTRIRRNKTLRFVRSSASTVKKVMYMAGAAARTRSWVPLIYVATFGSAYLRYALVSPPRASGLSERLHANIAKLRCISSPSAMTIRVM
jgi:glycosyltransferase involved in cell wall biosynthesis